MIEPVHNEAGALIGLRIPSEEPPRFRYFQKHNGPMFCWLIEAVDGYYASFIYQPVGSGSRSGRASQWSLDDESLRPHRLRKDAKARALRLYEEWLAERQP